ncbi:MAG: ABC transporter permease subunit [Spirochaetales bacterium]|nr:ABC transporter permease subunit [Spirochaetales bacterium]
MKRLAGSSLFWIVLLALSWEGIYRSGLFHPLVFPSLVDIIMTAGTDFKSGELPLNILSSMVLIFISFIPSIILAFLMTLLSGLSGTLKALFNTLANVAHPLPGIALLPVLILWTGLGQHIIVLVVIHSVLWPLLVNLESGIEETPEIWLNLGRNNGLTSREMFFQILLPGAYPYLLAGLKIGWARAWRAVISAEMIFGTISGGGGLGWYIFNKRIFMDSPGMFAGILILMVLGVLVDRYVFTPLEQGVDRRRGKTL